MKLHRRSGLKLGAAVCITVTVIAIGVVNSATHQKSGIKTSVSFDAENDFIDSRSARLIYDPSDLRQVAAVYDNIFVGRILRKVDTVTHYETLYTRYEVEVLQSLKGDVEGTIIVAQPGGEEGGKWVVYEDDVASREAVTLSDYFLAPRKTYLLSALYDAGQNQHIIGTTISERTAIQLPESLDSSQVQSFINKEEAVNQMNEAIKNQVLPSKLRERAVKE